MIKKQAKNSKGGNARAAKLSPEARKDIASKAAKARWGDKNNPVDVRGILKPKKNPAKASNLLVQHVDAVRAGVRSEIVLAVLNGLYSNLDNTTKFIAHHTPSIFREGMTLQEACNKLANMQASETVAYMLME